MDNQNMPIYKNPPPPPKHRHIPDVPETDCVQFNEGIAPPRTTNHNTTGETRGGDWGLVVVWVAFISLVVYLIIDNIK